MTHVRRRMRRLQRECVFSKAPRGSWNLVRLEFECVLSVLYLNTYIVEWVFGWEEGQLIYELAVGRQRPTNH